MLYTKKGDTGTTKSLNTKPGTRVTKSSCQTEALGALDELNSFLGLVKIKDSVTWSVDWKQPADIIHSMQNDLFTVQAEVAGADKHVAKEKVAEMEKLIDLMEKELPPIKTFFISGGTELASLFDIARTISRRAERRVVQVSDEGKIEIKNSTKAYLNRLSSVLYAFARLANHKALIKEESPDYK